jgi:Fe-S cluster assembly ATP-binding protein
MLLEIKNLRVKGNGQEILKGINLGLKKGEAQVLLGPNASGKSTLAQVIAGSPKYQVSQGKIFFDQKEITKLSPEKRTKMGIVLSWQNPPTIKGVKLSQLLEKIAKKKVENKKLDFDSNLLEREVNLDFSGGEKKMSELLQILSLNPKLVILDEVDSGLDLKRLEKVAGIIKKELIEKKISVLIITHSGVILRFLKPQMTNVMLKGKIICQEKDYKKVLKVIKKYGYEKCKKCQLLAG